MSDIISRADDTFCKSQLITCNRVKECNGVCPFEDALKHADKADIEFVTQTMNGQTVIDHDRNWIIGCIEHDGFIHTHRFDKANQIILDALSAEAGWIPVSERLPDEGGNYLITVADLRLGHIGEHTVTMADFYAKAKKWNSIVDVYAWMPLPTPYKGGDPE